MNYKFCLPNIGLINIPENIERFYSDDGFLISQRYGNNHYFEMDGEYLYYCLKYIEKKDKYNLIMEKKRIINALIRRSNICGGFWKHDGWVAGDTQLRATSSAVRTLIQGSLDNLVSKDVVRKYFDIHLKYHEQFKRGIWFLHDTAEYDGSILDSKRFKMFKANTWRSSFANTLTLNTHIDTINTILYYKKYCAEYFTEEHDCFLQKGMDALRFVLFKRRNILLKYIESIDEILLNKTIGYCNRNRAPNIIIKVYNRYYYPFFFKFLFPCYFFYNGYIERDMKKKAREINYHIDNLWDLCRLAVLLKNNSSYYEYNKILEYTIRSGINFIKNNNNLLSHICNNYDMVAQIQEIEYYYCLITSHKTHYGLISDNIPKTPIIMDFDPFGK